MISFRSDVVYVFEMVMVGSSSWPSATGTHLAVGTRVWFAPQGLIDSFARNGSGATFFCKKHPTSGVIVKCESRLGASGHSCKSLWTYSVMIDKMGLVYRGILSPEISPVNLGRPNFEAVMNGFVSEAVYVPTQSNKAGQLLVQQPSRPHNPDNSVKLKNLAVVTAAAAALSDPSCSVATRRGSAVGSSVKGLRCTSVPAAVNAAASRATPVLNDVGSTPPVSSSAVRRATRRTGSPPTAASRTNPVPVNAGGTGAAVPPAARTKSKNRLKPQRRAIKKVGRDSSGHRVCIHNIRLSLCKSCPGGGASLCEHQKQKCWCRVCGGSARCAHGKQRSRCVECGGAGICEHKKLRHRCSLCAACK